MENKPKITAELIESILGDLFYKRSQERKFIMYSGCISKPGQWVKRGGMELNICSDPNCPSCSMMNKALKDELTRMTFKPYDNKR